MDATHLPAVGTPLLVAVSGGADSMALWDLLELDGHWPLAVWHLDHGLRPDAADDARLIHARAQAYDPGSAGASPAKRRDQRETDAQQHRRGPTRIIIEHADIPALAQGWQCGIEEAGRRHRYARLAAIAQTIAAGAVLTAHHRDDQAETVLHHLLRGAGVRGLAGIAPTRPLREGSSPPLVRPLLGVTRADLRAHLRTRGLTWNDDPSNADHRHRRNAIRHDVLPTLEAGCPGIAAELARRASAHRLAHDTLAASAVRAIGGWMPGMALPASPLLALGPAARGEAWLRVCTACAIEPDRARLRRLDDLLHGAHGRRLRMGPWLFMRRRDRIDVADVPWRSPLGPRATRAPGAIDPFIEAREPRAVPGGDAMRGTPSVFPSIPDPHGAHSMSHASHPTVTAVILAAGKGTRMGSDLAKVLHPLAGRPLIAHVLDTCRALGVGQTVVVVGYQREAVESAIAPWRPAVAVQDRQLGTGHAVLVSRAAVSGDTVLVLCGDCPLTPAALLRQVLDKHHASGAACTGVAARMADPTGYGRMITDADGRLVRIVEQKDASAEECAIDLVNSGIYAFRRADLFRCLATVRADNAQGEYYLTDVVAMLARGGEPVELVVTGDVASVLGVNTPADLARAEQLEGARRGQATAR